MTDQRPDQSKENPIRSITSRNKYFAFLIAMEEKNLADMNLDRRHNPMI